MRPIPPSAPTSATQEEESITDAFWFSLAWGFAGSLATSDQERFDATFVRPNCRTLPSEHTIFDYMLDFKNGGWRKWTALAPQPPARAVDYRAYVPCVDAGRTLFLLRSLTGQVSTQPFATFALGHPQGSTTVRLEVLQVQCSRGGADVTFSPKIFPSYALMRAVSQSKRPTFSR